MRRAALYVRVSTQEQKKHGLSVDSQIKALTEYCQTNNYQIVEVYSDAGISARKRYTRRPALLRLINDCQQKKVDIILFTKLDRWFRSVSDYYEVQQQLDKTNVPWRAIWEDYETETSAGVFKVNIMLSVAQAESDRTSERIKSAMAYKAARGDYVGSAPIGYLVNKRDLIIDPDKREAVTAFFESFATSHNMSAAVRAAKAHGLSLTRVRARAMLLSETYSGSAAKGYECEAYITKEQYLINSDILNNRKIRTNKKTGRIYPFSGILKCAECGHGIHASVMSKRCFRAGEWRRYASVVYRCGGHFDRNICTNAKVYFETKIEDMLLDQIEKYMQEYRFAAECGETVDHSKEIEALKAKLQRVTMLFEEGDISLEEYKQKRDTIKETLARIPVPQKKILPELPENWKDLYKDLDAQHKQEFWGGIVRNIYIKEREYSISHIDFV